MEADPVTLEKVNDVYRRTWEYAQAHPEERLFRPASRKGEIGFTILYTPARKNPDVLICGQNPSMFGPRLDSEIDAAMLSGEIPPVNSYIAHDHEFAYQLRKSFNRHGMGRILEECVGMNLYFVQGDRDAIQTLSNDVRKFFAARTIDIVRAVMPKVILAVGMTCAFEAFAKKRPTNEQTDGRERIYAESFCGPIPVIGVTHLTGSRSPMKGQAMDMALERIRDLLVTA